MFRFSGCYNWKKETILLQERDEKNLKFKKYPVSHLQEGMVIGRGVYEEDLTVIVAEGTVLDRQMIDSLASRDVYFVYIRQDVKVEPPAPKKKNKQAALADAVRKSVDRLNTKVKKAPLSVQNVMPAPAASDKDAALASFMQDMADSIVHQPVLKKQSFLPTAKTSVAPQNTALLESDYVRQYNDVYLNLSMFYEMTRKSGHIDAVAAKMLAEQFLPLCDNAKAIIHIYNIKTKGQYAIHHSVRVAILAGLMGHWLKMQRSERMRLIMAAFLLDIGATRLASSFLKKKGFYTKEDRALMQKHVHLGHMLVVNSPFRADPQIVGAVLQHHERNDGSGYPDGLQKEQICGFARILAILDIYDAMSSKHAYAKEHSPFDVFAELSDEFVTGRLDVGYGVPFIKNICDSLNGSWVRLTNGDKGKIVYIDESQLAAQPVVQMADGTFVDLNTLKTIRVDTLLKEQE